MKNKNVAVAAALIGAYSINKKKDREVIFSQFDMIHSQIEALKLTLNDDQKKKLDDIISIFKKQNEVNTLNKSELEQLKNKNSKLEKELKKLQAANKNLKVDNGLFKELIELLKKDKKKIDYYYCRINNPDTDAGGCPLKQYTRPCTHECDESSDEEFKLVSLPASMANNLDKLIKYDFQPLELDDKKIESTGTSTDQ